MPIIYNNTTIDTLIYSDTNIEHGYYDNVEVFSSHSMVQIYGEATIDSGASYVNPPYDSQGYNHDGDSPTMENYVDIPLGDVTNYTFLNIVWDNSGSFNFYGTIYGDYTLNSVTTRLFEGHGDRGGTLSIDITELTGNQTLRIHTYAKNGSTYYAYGSKAVVNIRSIYAYRSDTPIVEPITIIQNYHFDSGTSVAPPPYDENGYSESAGSAVSNSYTVYLDNAAAYSTLEISWNNYDSSNPYGDIEGNLIKYIDGITSSSGDTQLLFDSPTYAEGVITIDLTGAVNNPNNRLVFDLYAKSDSTYQLYRSTAECTIVHVKMF